MICPRCLEREATVFFSRNINGKKEEYKVCEKCAKELGFFSDKDLFFNISDFMSGFMSKGISTPLISEKVCPVCGTSITELTKTSKLGCSKCYEVFDSYLEPVLKRIHGSVRHIGKLPETAQNSQNPDNTLSSLKEELKSAVSREDYEQAAVLRDKIKELEGGM